MTFIARLTLVASIFTFCFVPSGVKADTPAGFTHVSVRGNTASRGDASGRLNVIVWYPATVHAALKAIAVGPPRAPFFVEGKGARDALLASTPARVPLLVVSHGTGGTAMDLAWLCAGLAARGYIVAAVDHPGNNALEPPTIAGSTVWWLRADDLSRVIDGVGLRFGRGFGFRG